MSPYYKILLKEYVALASPLLIKELFNKYDAEMRSIARSDESLFFYEYGEKNELRLRQGAYLTLASSQLYGLFQSITSSILIKDKPLAESIFKEGAERKLVQTVKERNPKLKKEALVSYGHQCMVCGFDFDSFYGVDLANGYIELHHTKLLSESVGGRETKLKDVIVVCSNCHRIIHRKRSPLDWEILRANLKEKRGQFLKKE